MINAIKEKRGLLRFEGSRRGRDKRSDNGAETCRVAKGVKDKERRTRPKTRKKEARRRFIQVY